MWYFSPILKSNKLIYYIIILYYIILHYIIYYYIKLRVEMEIFKQRNVICFLCKNVEVIEKETTYSTNSNNVW